MMRALSFSNFLTLGSLNDMRSSKSFRHLNFLKNKDIAEKENRYLRYFDTKTG